MKPTCGIPAPVGFARAKVNVNGTGSILGVLRVILLLLRRAIKHLGV